MQIERVVLSLVNDGRELRTDFASVGIGRSEVGSRRFALMSEHCGESPLPFRRHLKRPASSFFVGDAFCYAENFQNHASTG